MTNERAIEILNPEHREHYPSIEPVNEACRMGMEALEKQIPKKPITVKNEVDGLDDYFCPTCKCIFLDGNSHFCDNCGQALDWT